MLSVLIDSVSESGLILNACDVSELEVEAASSSGIKASAKSDSELELS